MRLRVLLLSSVSLLVAAPSASATHIPGASCTPKTCASHEHWPTINGIIAKTPFTKGGVLEGGKRRDQLMGGHGSDRLDGREASDVLWGDHIPGGQPSKQRDRISGGPGNDFIYASHGRSAISGGSGNDAISAHFGRGTIDCGPGRDVYHVAKTRKAGWKIKNCEKVDYRSEAQRGGGLKPLR